MTQRLRVVFEKAGRARFISHLDLMATFEYAVRRAGLPVELSEGFNPRPRLSVAAPLPLGHVGEREILEMSLREPLSANDVQARFQSALPRGITVRSVGEVPSGRKLSASRLQSATYRIVLPVPAINLSQRIHHLLALERIEVEEVRDERVRTRDIRAMVLSLCAADDRTIRLNVRLGEDGTVRPEQILDLLSLSADGVQIIRERISLDD